MPTESWPQQLEHTLWVEPVGALPASIDYYYGLAARGPDYGVGNADSPMVGQNVEPKILFQVPVNVPGYYQPPKPTQIPENWAWIGPIPGRLTSIDRVGSINLDTGIGPLYFPCFNLAEPQGLYNLHIVTADQVAIWETNYGDEGLTPIPVTYEPGGPASLYGGK